MSQRLERIFLDMDGVLTDFVRAVLHLHGQPDALNNWPLGERDIPKVLNLSRTQYWKLIDAQGGDFWASLEPFPWFMALVELVREFAPMTILTSASLSPSSLEGKVRWMCQHFPKEKGRQFNDYLISPHKHLLARSQRVLIDDSGANVDAFRLAGGQAILFPQPWNSNYAITDPLEYVRAELLSMSQTA